VKYKSSFSKKKEEEADGAQAGRPSQAGKPTTTCRGPYASLAGEQLRLILFCSKAAYYCLFIYLLKQ